ncbi:fungal-specific transcription factor domain-containing protein [Mycena filopes]|nr:fungal-specific transcription factor domain-containing protein [Mycena filopes]
MASLTFQILSDQEIVDMKRTRGIMACAECQRRKLKCDKKFPCSSCVRRGRGDICPTGDMGPIGRGRRVVRSESLHLSTAIHHMGDRIHQLETAVADAHASSSSSAQPNNNPDNSASAASAVHPLLREELLSIKEVGELARASEGDRTPSQLGDGAMALNPAGTGRYFGPTAGPSAYLSAQGSAGGDRAAYAPFFASATSSFPFASPTAWDPPSSLALLRAQLPPAPRAWALHATFAAAASWYITPLPASELAELLLLLYSPSNFNPPSFDEDGNYLGGGGSDYSDENEEGEEEVTPHALALVFLALASAALADLSLPPYSAEADRYFDLGRAALALAPVFGSRDLHTIQALMLAGVWYATGGPRYSFDSSWTIAGLACSLAQTLGLHLEKTHLPFPHAVAERRRALFWEVRSMETYNALSFARPLTFNSEEITCQFPADAEETVDGEGRRVPGFFHAKWTFTKEITAAMAQGFSCATPPTYEEVLSLDRRLRHFMETGPFAHYATRKPGAGGEGEEGAFLAHVRAHIIPRFCGNLMLYIHRASFVSALKTQNHPQQSQDPLEGPYAASFLAAYRGASMIIKSDVRSFALFPERFHRWWPIWKSLVNAAFIAGSIVSKCPSSPMAPAAFAELLAAVDLVEQGATHSFLAEGSVAVLRRLRNRASAAYAAARPLEASLALPLPHANHSNNNNNNFTHAHTHTGGHDADASELASDADFEHLGGSRALPTPDPGSSRLPTPPLALPALLPDAMPVPLPPPPPPPSPSAMVANPNPNPDSSFQFGVAGSGGFGVESWMMSAPVPEEWGTPYPFETFLRESYVVSPGMQGQGQEGEWGADGGAEGGGEGGGEGGQVYGGHGLEAYLTAQMACYGSIGTASGESMAMAQDSNYSLEMDWAIFAGNPR